MKKALLLLLTCLFTVSLVAELVIINPGETEPFTINLLESNVDYSRIEIKVNYYFKKTVTVQGIAYNIINIPSTGIHAEKGDPNLIVIARSLMIPMIP